LLSLLCSLNRLSNKAFVLLLCSESFIQTKPLVSSFDSKHPFEQRICSPSFKDLFVCLFLRLSDMDITALS
jgi:hypothetical protein